MKSPTIIAYKSLLMMNVTMEEVIDQNLQRIFSILCFYLVPVTDVDSCYLIKLCGLCGTNPIRGVCLPQNNEAKCECFSNKNDSSRPYAGELCDPTEPQSIKSPSIPSSWTPVIVGVLAGLTGLFCVITCCLWAMAVWRRRNRPNKYVLFIKIEFIYCFYLQR
jgi:hypothetical protein